MGRKTLLNDLLYSFKESTGKFKSYNTIMSFRDLIFPAFDDVTSTKGLYRSDSQYRSYWDCDLKGHSPFENACRRYMDDEDYLYEGCPMKKYRKKCIKEFVKQCIMERSMDILKGTLISCLEEVDFASHTQDSAQKIQDAISQLEIPRNKEDEKAIEAWTNHMYYYFYFAVTDKLHQEMALTLYRWLAEDLAEYNNETNLMYGAAGNPGMQRLYAIADRPSPNIVALYECGELEYYGKGASGRVNYNKAYEYYEKTLCCNKEHPLAAWSMAYMRFHYSTELAKKQPQYRVDEFENELFLYGKNMNWYNTIMNLATSAYDNGCSAAANLIGQILDSSEDDFPSRYRGRFKNRNAKEMYKESADANYIYGCNNYAVACLNDANKTSGKQKIELLIEAKRYLCKSADKGNCWASNKIGYFYYKGLTCDKTDIFPQDEDEAYRHFGVARKMSFADDYYWPIINLFNLFWFNDKSSFYNKLSDKELSDYYEDVNEAVDRLVKKSSISFKYDEGNKKQLEKLREIAEKMESLIER